MVYHTWYQVPDNFLRGLRYPGTFYVSNFLWQAYSSRGPLVAMAVPAYQPMAYGSTVPTWYSFLAGLWKLRRFSVAYVYNTAPMVVATSLGPTSPYHPSM